MLSFSQPKHLKITIFRHFKRTTGLVLYRFSSWSAYSKIPAISFSPNSKTYFRRLPPFSSTNSGWRLGSKTRDTRLLRREVNKVPQLIKSLWNQRSPGVFGNQDNIFLILISLGKLRKRLPQGNMQSVQFIVVEQNTAPAAVTDWTVFKYRAATSPVHAAFLITVISH